MAASGNNLPELSTSDKVLAAVLCAVVYCLTVGLLFIVFAALITCINPSARSGLLVLLIYLNIFGIRKLPSISRFLIKRILVRKKNRLLKKSADLTSVSDGPLEVDCDKPFANKLDSIEWKKLVGGAILNVIANFIAIFIASTAINRFQFHGKLEAILAANFFMAVLTSIGGPRLWPEFIIPKDELLERILGDIGDKSKLEKPSEELVVRAKRIAKAELVEFQDVLFRGVLFSFPFVAMFCMVWSYMFKIDFLFLFSGFYVLVFVCFGHIFLILMNVGWRSFLKAAANERMLDNDRKLL